MQIATLLLLTKVSPISLKPGSTFIHSDSLELLTLLLEMPKPQTVTLLLARVDLNNLNGMNSHQLGNYC